MEIPERLVFLDVETTGLKPKDDRIIEIFMFSIDADGKVDEYETLINPERKLPSKIVELTGLTDDQLVNAPKESEIASDVREFIGLGTPVAHNLPFDRGFLNAMFLRNNLLDLGMVGIDTLSLSRQVFPKLCIYPHGGGSHRLGNLMYHFGLQDAYANSHRAKDDVMLLVEVFRHLQEASSADSKTKYPQAMTHGCPSCGTVMYLRCRNDEHFLVCRNIKCKTRIDL